MTQRARKVRDRKLKFRNCKFCCLIFNKEIDGIFLAYDKCIYDALNLIYWSFRHLESKLFQFFKLCHLSQDKKTTKISGDGPLKRQSGVGRLKHNNASGGLATCCLLNRTLCCSQWRYFNQTINCVHYSSHRDIT